MESIEFSRFVRVDRSVPECLLKNDELRDVREMVYSAEGKYLTLRKRSGISLFSESSADEKIRFLSECIDELNMRFILCLCGVKLKFFDLTNETWRYTGIDYSGEVIPKVTSVGVGKYLVHLEGNTPFLISGKGFIDILPVEIAAPDITNVKSAYYPNLGGLSSGRYKYCLVYETKEGESSAPSEHFTHLLNDEGLSSENRGMIVLTDIPVSTDKRVTKKRIYRTIALQNNDNHFLFYLRKVIENDVTKFEDGLDGSDDNLGVEMPVYLNFPLKAACSLVHQDRLILGNVSVKVLNYFAPPRSDKSSNYLFRVTGDTPSETGPTGNAVYKYRIVFVDSDGIESNYLETAPYKTKDEECRKVTLSGLPVCGGGIIKEGLRRRIYRTKRNGNTFYFLTDIDYDGSSLIGGDTINDVDLGRAMQVGGVVEKRVCGVSISEAGSYGTFRNENFLEVQKEDNDEIMALIGREDGFLVVKHNSIVKVFTNISLNAWKVVPFLDGVGVDSFGGIIKSSAGVYLASTRGLYLLQGSKINKVSGKVEDWFLGCSSINQIVEDIEESKIMVLCKSGDGDAVIIYDEVTGGFSKWLIAELYYLLPIWINGSRKLLVGGDEYLRLFNSTSESDFYQGSNHKIEASVTTGTHNCSLVKGLMRIRNIYIKMESSGIGGVVVKILSGEKGECNKYDIPNLEKGLRTVSFPIEKMEQPNYRYKEFSIDISGEGLKGLHTIIVEYKLENKKDRSI